MKIKQLQKILAHFALQASKILSSEKGYRNQVIPIILKQPQLLRNASGQTWLGQKICLVIYKNEPQILNRIKRANFVSDFLATQNFPSKKTLATPQGQTIFKLKANSQTRYACLYEYLPGQTISWDAYTQKHLKLLGQALAFTHQTLANIGEKEQNWPNALDKLSKLNQQTNWPDALAELRKLNQKMQFYFAQAEVTQAVKKKLGLNLPAEIFTNFNQLFKLAEHKLKNQQILHLDFVRSNLLFGPAEFDDDTTASSFKKGAQLKDDQLFAKNLQLSSKAKFQFKNLILMGILDWEKSAVGDPIIDLARTLAFLLVDCQYKTPAQITKYFLKSGYQKHGQAQLSQQQLQLLKPLLSFFLFYDFYKFLLHNPYEALAANQHFIKTRTILLKKKIVWPVEAN